jgi:hypothetical protein
LLHLLPSPLLVLSKLAQKKSNQRYANCLSLIVLYR